MASSELSDDSKLHARSSWRLWAVAIASGLVMLCWSFTPISKERLLHAIGMRSQAEHDLLIELNAFQNLLLYVFYHADYPRPQSPPETLEAFFKIDFPRKAHVFGSGKHYAFRYLQTGVDPWGNPFVFETKRIGERQFSYVLRSIGANCIDEQGLGDDLTPVSLPLHIYEWGSLKLILNRPEGN